MYFFLAFLMVFFGMFLSGACSMLPPEMLVGMPLEFRYLLFIMGFVLAFVGLFLLYLRCLKLGIHHLIAPGRPDNIIWFYVHRDKSIKITPSIRVVENQLYSKELDAQISDMASYKLFDHLIRFVPEGVGHSVDLDTCLYVAFLKSKYDFSNITEARKGIARYFEKVLPIIPKKEVSSQEHLISGKGLEKKDLLQGIDKERKRT